LDEADDLLRAIEQELRKRRLWRLYGTAKLKPQHLKECEKGSGDLDLDESDVYEARVCWDWGSNVVYGIATLNSKTQLETVPPRLKGLANRVTLGMCRKRRQDYFSL